MFRWSGCVRFIVGENNFAKCWYLGCNLIVHAIKDILLLFLCVDGCDCNILDVGPGFILISPLRSSKLCNDSILFSTTLKRLISVGNTNSRRKR